MKSPTCVLLFPSAFYHNALLIHHPSNQSCVQLQHDSSLITCFSSLVTSTDHRDFSSSDHQCEGPRQYTAIPRIFSEHRPMLCSGKRNGEVWHYSKNRTHGWLAISHRRGANVDIIASLHEESACSLLVKLGVSVSLHVSCDCVRVYLGDSWDWHQSPPVPWSGEKQNYELTKGCI